MIEIIKHHIHTLKFLKRTILTLLLIISICILFRGCIFRNIITYKSVSIRPHNYLVKDRRLAAVIDSSVGIITNPNIKQIIECALKITSEQLNFTVGQNDIDPNKLVYSRTAHCVGYASFFKTVCNYLFKKLNFDNNWSITQRIGKLYIFGINIHGFFSSPFFKDHDFVTIENIKTGEKFAIDPTISDYFCITFVNYKE